MKTRLSKEEKQALINRYLSGESVRTIVSDTGVARSSLYSWIKSYKVESNNNPNITLNNLM